MQGHKRVKHGGAPELKCDQCTFKTFRRGAMNTHIQKHEGVRFKCEYCDYQIGDQGSLRKHIILVHKEDVYKCDLCDFTANYKIRITNHSRNKH